MGNIKSCIEARIAEHKTNALVDRSLPPLPVAPDADHKDGPGGFDHSLWDDIMRHYVTKGTVQGINANVVDYQALAKDPNFDAYLEALSTVDMQSLLPNEQLALYINAYNALCIGHVVRYMKENNGHLPESVTKAGVGRTEVWDVKAGVIGGESVSLNDIEHRFLRSRWLEPRVHASIVCASASCPNLRQEAFVPARLNAQMDDQCKEWLADTTKGLEFHDGSLCVSRILLWFRGDFASVGGPLSWIRGFLGDDQARELKADMPVQYFVYNWSLNARHDQSPKL